MRTALAALFLALAVPASAQGTIYRCKGADGRLSFQQTPCEAGTTGEQVEAKQVPTTELGANILQRAQRNAERRDQTTETDMLNQLGHPTVTNVDIVNGVETKQHVYRYPDGSARYIYTRNGVVYAAQVRPGEGPRQTQPCYSKSQIRSAEFDASNIRLTPQERIAANDRVAKMRNCRR